MCQCTSSSTTSTSTKNKSGPIGILLLHRTLLSLPIIGSLFPSTFFISMNLPTWLTTGLHDPRSHILAICSVSLGRNGTRRYSLGA